MKKQLEQRRLERLIRALLKEQTVCVLATCSRDVPRASTVEYFPSGITLYILTEGGKKIGNIRDNPHVSVAVHAPFSGWPSVKGVQITGLAEIGEPGDTVFEEGRKSYGIRRGLKKAVLPDFMKVIKITPSDIEYLDASLGGKGYSARQILLCAKKGDPDEYTHSCIKSLIT